MTATAMAARRLPNQVIVPRDLVEGREDQRDAVPDGEHRDELGDVLDLETVVTALRSYMK